MAKKKLNKKIALIGSAAFVVLAGVAILAILHLSKDPEKFIQDGDAALERARKAEDEEIRQEAIGLARSSYRKAYRLVKTDAEKVEMVFKLVDIFLDMNEWNEVQAGWNQIIRLDPKNAKARYARLKYTHVVANNGVQQFWKEVEVQASELLEVAGEDLLSEYPEKLECFETQRPVPGAGSRLGAYLYLLKGRGLLEMIKTLQVTDPDESLDQVIRDLEKVIELEPNNVYAREYLAGAFITRGKILASRGDIEGKSNAINKAREILEQGIKAAETDPRAYLNLLTMKLGVLFEEGAGREQISALEPEYLALVKKFDSSAQAFAALCGFYRMLGHKKLDEAIESCEKTVELDPQNVTYAIMAANLNYEKGSIYGETEVVHKGIEIAAKALELPQAQDAPGPEQWANKTNRISLYVFLANCYIQQALSPTVTQYEKWLADAENAVHQIEQLYGSGEDPHVLKWQGMLEFAKGNRDIAARKLYATYEQLKGSGQNDATISYALVKLFENTVEIGAAEEFFRSALSFSNRSAYDRIDRTRPEALLDYVEILLKLRAVEYSINVIDFFENEYWVNERSRKLRTSAYITASRFEEAEKELAKFQPDDPNKLKLSIVLTHAKIRQIQLAMAQKRQQDTTDFLPAVQTEETVQETDESMMAELKGHIDTIVVLVEKLLTIEPNSVEEASVSTICNSYIAEGKVEQAKRFVDRCLEYFPDNVTILFYKQVLSEPEPAETIGAQASIQKRNEIEKKVLSGIDDPTKRAINLSLFYIRNNEPNEAIKEFRKVVSLEELLDDTIDADKLTDSQRFIIPYFFDVALMTRSWDLAQQIQQVARLNNLDDCEGNFFGARFAMARNEYQDAMVMLDECLRLRPIFSQALVLRSSINAQLGHEDISIQDAQRAAFLSPLSGIVAERLAFAFFVRDQKLGGNVPSGQAAETKKALISAMSLNPDNAQLRSLYAEYISQESPDDALAIRQGLQKTSPSVNNALLLGRMAMRMALGEEDAERKKFLFDTADSSFEQALAIEPQNTTVLEAYAEYYRITEQEAKAEELLGKTEDKTLLWKHYFRARRFADAKQVLETLYQTNPKERSVVAGLLVVAQATGNGDAAKKYSEDLLLIDDSVASNILIIQVFLKMGLIKETELNLQSFKEKFPNEPGIMLLEAWLAMRKGQLKKALELVNRRLETDQDSATAWRLRGEINRLMVKYDQAMIDLQRSLSIADDPVTRLALARVYLSGGRGNDAVVELKSIMDHPEVATEAMDMIEQTYQQTDKKEELLEFYREVLDKFPDDLSWYNRAGTFALSIGDFKNAEVLFAQAWQKGKNDPQEGGVAFYRYLQSLLLNGKINELFEEAQQYVDTEFAPPAFFRMGEAKLKLGDRAAAIEYCRKAVDKAGEGELASNILSEVYRLLGPEEVLKYCQERLKANPESLAVNIAVFQVARLNGEYNKALTYIDKCLEIISSDPQRQVWFIIEKALVLQLAYSKTSDKNYLERTIATYESLLDKMPNNADALNNLAYLLAENNERLPEALQYAENAHELRPYSAGFMDTYAYVLYKNDNYAKADEVIQASLQQYEQDRVAVPADVYEHLGMIKEKLGEKIEAVDAYRRALEAGADTLTEPTKERIESAIQRLSR